MATIMQRKKILINTDPQRRCYNGVHFSSKLVWSEWEALETCEDAEDRIKFWQDLNDYAVSQRGAGAKCEFKIV